MKKEKENRSKFTSCQNKGFEMTFDNGMTMSVQWGVGNYCFRRSLNSTVLSEMKEVLVSSEDVEIAIWDIQGNWFDFGGSKVRGFCSADEVAEIMWMVKSSNSLEELKEKMEIK